MVRPDPSSSAKYGAVFNDEQLKRADQAAMQTKAVSLLPAKRQTLSILNVSLVFVVLAAMLAWFRRDWLPPPQQSVSVMNPFQNVFEWISKDGAEMGNINVIGFDGYYELTATGQIEKGERLVTVPMNLILDQNTVIADETVQSVLETTDLLDENGAAVVCLLANQEKWGVYLEMMQELEVQSPMFWSEIEIEMLKGSMINRMMAELKSILSEQYAAVEQFFTGLTFEDYTRLWVNVNSRMWQLQKSETESINALMPIFDFAAHSSEPNVEIGYDPELDAVVMTSILDISPSESIQNFYYNTSNVHNLLFQGFTVPDNDANLACEVEINGNRCSVESNVETSSADALVKCVSEYAEDKTTLESVNDIWTKVSESAFALLKEFPNTVAEDEKLLRKELPSLVHNAVEARRCEKVCLNQIKSFSDLMSTAIATKSWDAIDLAVASSSDAQAYVESVKALESESDLSEQSAN